MQAKDRAPMSKPSQDFLKRVVATSGVSDTTALPEGGAYPTSPCQTLPESSASPCHHMHKARAAAHAGKLPEKQCSALHTDITP